jgi:hypothetical protein
LPGIHGYTDRKSLFAGDTIRFHISSTVPYRLSVCQPGPAVDDRASDTVLHAFPPSEAHSQPIHPGSYVFVENGLSPASALKGLTLECWVQPWSLKTSQAILGQFDATGGCGYGLFINEVGQITFYLGDGGAFQASHLHSGPRLQEQQWSHVVGSWDGATKSLWVNGQPVGRWTGPETVNSGPAPLRLGASGQAGVAVNFLEGDLLMPVIYERGLSGEEIAARYAQKGLQTPTDRAVVACWPLREQKGDTVSDISGYQRTGKIINQGTWMIVGPAFEPDKLNFFSENDPPYNPFEDPTRGNGLRLSSDDLFDCRWEVTHEFKLPEEARSGIYFGRIDYEEAGEARVYYITFIVKKARHKPTAPVLVLVATNSWLAYSASPFAKNTPPNPVWPRRAVGLPDSHPLAPHANTYNFRKGGQPSYYIGLRMPWPDAAPDALYDPEDAHWGQWAWLERHLHIWLDQAGYAYDIISDLDFHKEPELLKQYKTVIINGHSEYWSLPMYQGLDRYLSNGGTAIVLSGNTMIARVSFNDDFSVMEQRKTLKPVSDMSVPPPGGPHGEQYHSQDWKRGGSMNACGYPTWDVIGLGSVGWACGNADDFGVYKVTNPEHFLFNEPHRLGLKKGDTFGHGPDGELPRAIGHEWDLRVNTIAKMTKLVPEGEALPLEPPGITTIAEGIRRVPGPMDGYLDFYGNITESIDGLSAEMIYWERPAGGIVFNAGAVCASWVLGVDPHFEKLLQNVLYRFGVQPGEA